MCTGVSAPEALVLICARNDLFCYNRIGWRLGCVSGMSGVCLWREFTSAPNQRRNATPSSNFRGRTVGPICQVFPWTDVPRMRLQLKILFEIKTLPIIKKSGETCGGGGGGRCHPPPLEG